METPSLFGLINGWKMKSMVMAFVLHGLKTAPFNVNLRSRELIDFQSRRWNLQAMEKVFVPSDIQTMLKNQPVVSKEDFWVWKFNKSGAYSVKSGYWLAAQDKSKELQRVMETLPLINVLKAKSWKVQTAPKN